MKLKTNVSRLRRGIQTKVAMTVLLVTATLSPTATAAAAAVPESFADLAEERSPAVVNISTVQNVPIPRGRRFNFPNGTPFGDFFDQFRERNEGQRDDEGEEDEEEQETREARSLGSGFIIDADGYVVTNNHVVEDADEITVTMTDGTEFSASVIGRDARLDLALLKVESDTALPSVAWGDSDGGRVGDWVVAIGNPFGLGGSVTAGIISARNRLNVSGPFIDFIQTDAPINRGNSGGPLFNMDGRVIGVNTAIFSPSGGSVGIGFAIPSNLAQTTIAQLREFGRVRRGWLGVGIQPVTEDIAKSMKLDTEDGALVTSVADDSPAAKGGVEVGDVILEWDGKPAEDAGALSRLVARTDIGKEVTVKLLRRGEPRSLTIVTGELPDTILDQGGNQPERQRRERPRRSEADNVVQNMQLSELTDEARERFDIGEDQEGVLVSRVSRRSEAFGIGIRRGTLIKEVDQKPVATPEDVSAIIDAALEAGSDSVLVLIHLRGNTVYVVLPIEEDG